MRKLVLFLFFSGSTSVLLGQGTLNFSSFASGVNAPVTNSAGVRITGSTPGDYRADFYYSTSTSANTTDLQPAGFNVLFSTLTLSGGGYFLGGSRTINGSTGTLLGQVRVWSAANSWEVARDSGLEYGFSVPFLITLSIPTSPPPAMVGLQGFRLFPPVPEPRPGVFVALGLVGLLVWRRIE